MKWGFILALLVGLLGACGSDSSPSDSSDSGPSDAKDVTVQTDTSEGIDDGTSQNETILKDAPLDEVMIPDSNSDVSLEDSETDVTQSSTEWPLQVPCIDSSQAVYALGAADIDLSQPLGTVVGCAPVGTITPDKVAAAMNQVGIETTSGIVMKRIAYLTKRGFGEVGLATARVLIPDPPPEAPVSVLVVTHGTVGLADTCAPSRNPPPNLMGVPFAGNKTVVVSPDYAGLGNEGVQGYHDSYDTAHSVLDAARAVHGMLETGYLTKKYAIMGHSQGGGAALYAQGLASTYVDDLDLVGVVAFAPGWTSSATPSKTLYSTPQFVPVTIGVGVGMAARVFAHYADAHNYVDSDNPGLYFSDTWRETLVQWIESMCVEELAKNFMEMDPGLTAADLFDESFLMVSLSCLQDEAGCTEPTKGYVDRLKANYIPMDGSGAPAIIIQGMSDGLVTPKKAACNVKAMNESGFEPWVSVDPQATHFDIVKRNIGLAYGWVQAKINGTEPPTWDFDATTLPMCD